MNQLAAAPAPDDPPDDCLDINMYAARREAIDQIATMRARMIRCALFGQCILRPHPFDPQTPAVIAGWREKFDEQVADMDRACAFLRGHDPAGTVPQEICDWIGECAQQLPDDLHNIEEMRRLTRDVENAFGNGDAQLDGALKAHFAFGRTNFFHSVTAICDGLWAQLDAKRDADICQAQETGTAIAEMLKRLERIGKHVKLVSLNASVEAARIGEAGKGIGVIAVEFKSLAEEIQDLALTARKDIETLTQNTDL